MQTVVCKEGVGVGDNELRRINDGNCGLRNK